MCRFMLPCVLKIFPQMVQLVKPLCIFSWSANAFFVWKCLPHSIQEIRSPEKARLNFYGWTTTCIMGTEIKGLSQDLKRRKMPSTFKNSNFLFYSKGGKSCNRQKSVPSVAINLAECSVFCNGGFPRLEGSFIGKSMAIRKLQIWKRLTINVKFCYFCKF